MAPPTEEQILEEQLKRLRLSRRSHRGQLTKLLSNSDNLTGNLDDLDSLHSLEGVLDSMDSKLECLQQLDAQIHQLTPLDELEAAIIEADDYTEDHKGQVRRQKRFFKEANKQDSKESKTKSSGKKVHLPKLNLPKFSGDTLQYISFREMFDAAIHNDNQLDRVEKFQYLKGVLEGEAAAAVAGLPLTSNNYDEALGIIHKRYGQPHKIIHRYMRALWELPKASDTSVKEFYDKLELYVRGLHALGKEEDSYGDLLIPVILDRLPPKMRTHINRQQGDDAWSLRQLLDAIYKEIQADETSEDLTLNSLEPSAATFHVSSKKHSTRPQQKQQYFHTNSSQSQTEGNQKSENRGRYRNQGTKHKGRYSATPSKCQYCGDDHKPHRCVKVTDPQKRLEKVLQDRLCVNCLQNGHRLDACTNPFRCLACKGKHHTTLCGAKFPWDNNQDGDQRRGTHVTLTPTTTDKGPVLLKTARAKVISKDSGRRVAVNILFDEGSQRTFVTRKVAEQLETPYSRQERVHISTFGATQPRSEEVDVVDLTLQTRSSNVHLSALVVSKIATPVPNHISQAVTAHSYLQGLELADHVASETFEINLLIGADYYWEIVGNDIVRGPGPTAISSKLGYLLSGPTGGGETAVNNVMVYQVMTPPITSYWDLETVGIKDDPGDSPTITRFKDDLQMKDGKYIASLPWKEDHPPLPTNYKVAEGRTQALIRKMSDDTRKIYSHIIKDQLKRGFIEAVEEDDITDGHYIPHHSVHKDSVTTPLRIVYDCSCKVGSHPSLNDCLEVGPNLGKDITQILLRFRVHSIGLVSDIEKAFLNIEMNEEDRPYTKFLWLEDPENPQSRLKTYRFRSILFGATSSPFILNSVIQHHLESSPSKTNADMLKNIYVDNLISGTQESQQAVDYYKESIQTLHQGGFNLRSWASNDKHLRDAAESDGRLDPDQKVKTLGMFWNTEEDMLCYTKSPTTDTQLAHTKREVVRRASQLFDPLGFLAPVHVQAKIFIQQLWKEDLGWDDLMSDTLQEEWISIQRELDDVTQVTIKRVYFQNQKNTSPLELHAFADASTKAYGAAIYIKNNTESAFVVAKTRVKPLKEITLPRLELLAAFIASRLTRFVVESLDNLPIARKVLWSDSQITLHWIHSSKSLPLFVKNRVKAIHDIKFDDIKYCPTDDNPADLLTRGVSAQHLKNSTLWLKGPSWLTSGEWPSWPALDNVLACQISEESSEPDVVKKDDGQPLGIHQVMDITRYSSLDKALRVTAYVLRFISRVKRTPQGTSKHVTVTEIITAKNHWIRSVQADYVQDMGSKSKKKSIARQLKLFLDKDGIVRCGGRLHNSNIKFNSKHPVLLPRKHHFTELVVKWAHKLVLHAGPGTTLTFIRDTYWIPQIRQLVKTTLRSCVTCRKVNGPAYRSPETPPLPKLRIEEAPPFSVTGVDFTGALFYRTNTTQNKAYICLFTCAITRAVHLEVVTNMTTESFIAAFRRFAARRSLPSHIISDNGSTFLAASTEVQRVCNGARDFMVSKNVEWSFIPKRAPWFGGFYERLVGVTKTVLKKVLAHSLLTLDELSTLVTEVESVVNDRPLTYVPSTLDEPEPLTPSMLLSGKRNHNLPHQSIDIEEIKDPDHGASCLQKRQLYLDSLFKQLWVRWRQEYLPALRETHSNNTRNRSGETANTIQLGDIVLIHEDNHKRVHWPMGMVTSLRKGNDGLVRSAEVRMKDGTTNRPIAKLYPLEVSADLQDEADMPDDKPTETHDDVRTDTRRPQRQAANRAGSIIKQWAKQLV